MSGYRYGFNGKENDNEVKGEGMQQDYGMRVYDARLGRFLSVAPITKQYPELTPYQFASNRPIEGVDQDGMEVAYWDKNTGHYSMPSDAIRHPIPKGTYLPSIRALEGGKAQGVMMSSGYMVAGATLAVATAPAVSALVVRGFWSVALWASQPQNQMLAAEGGALLLSTLNPGPEDINPASSSDELGRAVGKSFKAIAKTIFDEDGFAVVRDGAGKLAGKGWLYQGELNLWIKTKGTTLQGKGGEVFNDILDFVNQNYDDVTAIRGTWRAGEMGDNLNTFNKLVGEVGAEKAALQTFTGKLAERAGFNKVQASIRD